MLVLTRKLKEQIRIGDNVTITVLRVKGQAVRIGIEAPRAVRVVRGELTCEEVPTSDGGGGEPAAASPPLAGDVGTQDDEPVSSILAADEQRQSASPRRLPQRRLMNRYGAPPLRLACSHAFAGSETT